MAKKTIKAQMKQRRDTKANWAATNPVLLDGELGIVSDDPNLYKVGDGATAWNSLPFRGFDGTLAQELGTSPNAVISQKVVSEKLTELESKVGDIISFDLSNATIGKYLANGEANEDAGYLHKEFDVKQYRNKVLSYRLGYHYIYQGNDNLFPSDSCFMALADNSIIPLDSLRINFDAEVDDAIIIHVPNDAVRILASWSPIPEYSMNPFILYDPAFNYLIKVWDDDKENLNNIGLLAACSEIDINNYESTDGYIDKGVLVPEKTLGIKIITIPVSPGTIVFAKGEITSFEQSIAYTFNAEYNKYEPILPCLVNKLEGDHYYALFCKVFNSETTIYIQRWVSIPRSNASIAIGKIGGADNTIFQSIKSNGLKNDVKYIAIGDSITDGVGSFDNNTSYANYLNNELHFASFQRLAQGGMSVVRQSGNYSSYPLLKEKIALVPNGFDGIISVSVGTNDYGNGHSPLGNVDDIRQKQYSELTPTPSSYSEGYTFAEGFRYDLETLKIKCPNAKIVVLFPINRVGEDTEYYEGVNLDSFRDVERQICGLLGIDFIDMRFCGISKWNTSPKWSPDDLHPNDYGYALMTSYLLPFFKNYIISQAYINSTSSLIR